MFDSKRKKKKALHFELIPMIDVMMILVIFLAIMAFLPSVQNALQTEVPTSSTTTDKVEDKDIVLTIDKGVYTLKGKPVSPDNLIPSLKAEVAKNPEVRIIVAANKELSFEVVVAVLDELRKNKITNLALATENLDAE